jgi:hypothetical protein
LELRVPGYGHVIRVVLVEARKGWARLGIDAPREVAVVRGENAAPGDVPSYGSGLTGQAKETGP